MAKLKLNIPSDFFKEEERSGFHVSTNLKKVWAVEIDLLNELLNVCHKYGISICAAGGTLLGAVRHNGMIPWDDDIDLMLFREEYDKLCRIAPLEFKDPYFFQTEETDKGSYRGHAQLRRSDTTGILSHELFQAKTINQGIFIDIFPLDNLPNDMGKCRKHLWKLALLRNIHKICLLKSLPFKFDSNELKRSIVLAILRAIIPYSIAVKYSDSLYYRWINCMQKYNYKRTEYVVMSPFYTKRWIWKRKDLEVLIEHGFEMIRIPIPLEYDKILKLSYGNWHKLVVGNSMHGATIFDTEKPYTDYLEKSVTNDEKGSA